MCNHRYCARYCMQWNFSTVAARAGLVNAIYKIGVSLILGPMHSQFFIVVCWKSSTIGRHYNSIYIRYMYILKWYTACRKSNQMTLKPGPIPFQCAILEGTIIVLYKVHVLKWYTAIEGVIKWLWSQVLSLFVCNIEKLGMSLPLCAWFCLSVDEVRVKLEFDKVIYREREEEGRKERLVRLHIDTVCPIIAVHQWHICACACVHACVFSLEPRPFSPQRWMDCITSTWRKSAGEAIHPALWREWSGFETTCVLCS